ncbi:MAG: hypothetical protein LBB79_03430, partial [Prevotellaceae bacterium]|nr:hypothetical protein [Prevotellaceae bacterium]
MRTFSTLFFAGFLALGLASCSDDKEPENTKTATTATLAVTHPNYANGVLSVVVGNPVTIGASNVEVTMEPAQEYTLELVPEDNEYFSFTSDGLLTGKMEGDDAGDIVIRLIAENGKTLASELIPVSVVGILVTIVNHESYENDTFRVVANEEFLLSQANVKVEPDKPEYRIAFAPKATRYFTFGANGILHGTLDGTGTIEALVMSGDDTLKVQPFNVKVSPDPAWVTAVTVTGNNEGNRESSKTQYFHPTTGMTKELAPLFEVTGG